MNTYCVILASEGNIKLDQPLIANINEQNGGRSKVLCETVDPTGPDSPINAHQGLLLDVRVEADSIDDALSKAGNGAEVVVSSLVVQSMGSQKPCQIQLAYDATDGMAERPFRQFFEVPISAMALRMANSQEALQLMAGLINLPYQSERPRVTRAIQYLRRGYEIEDGLRRFEEFWIGLECLNPLLQKMLQPEPATGQCSECGASYKKQELRGVKAFTQAVAGEDVYKKVTGARIDIFHGLVSFVDAQTAATDLSSVLEGILYRAVRYCLGLDIAAVKLLSFESLHGYSSPRLLFKARLLNSATGPLGLDGKHPHFTLHMDERPITENGQVVSHEVDYVFSPHIACDGHIDELVLSSPTGLKLLSYELTERDAAPGTPEGCGSRK